MSYNLRTFEPVDQSTKTVTIQPGGGITGAIKESLSKEGWKIVVYRGPDVTKGAVGDQTALEQVRTFNTRYAIFLRWQQIDTCIPTFDPEYHYDISLVDN